MGLFPGTRSDVYFFRLNFNVSNLGYSYDVQVLVIHTYIHTYIQAYNFI